MKLFYRFYEIQWMGRVGPQSFSVFGQAERTNNCQESFHRHLNSAMGRPHPNAWKFLGNLLKIVESLLLLFSMIFVLYCDY